MKILVALDGSHFAEAVLGPLAALADSRNSELYLVKVVRESDARASWSEMPSGESHRSSEMVMPGGFGGSIPEGGTRAPAETLTQAQDRLRQESEDYLERMNEKYFSGKARSMVLWGDDPASTIADYAENQKVDLIAIATHGRTGLAGMLMGSVANTLLQSGVAPLFMVRPNNLE